MNTIDERVLDQVPVAKAEDYRNQYRVLRFNFRWSVRTIDPDGSPKGDLSTLVEMRVPIGNGQPILNPKWVEMLKMTDEQVDKAECFILRQVAILPEA